MGAIIPLGVWEVAKLLLEAVSHWTAEVILASIELLTIEAADISRLVTTLMEMIEHRRECRYMLVATRLGDSCRTAHEEVVKARGTIEG